MVFPRFYDFQPDLNWSNPDVRAEIAKVMAFWLQLGASGFRIDAAPFVLGQVSPVSTPDLLILDSWRQETQWQQGDSVLLCEANVTPQDVVQLLARVAMDRGPGADDVRLPAQPADLARVGPK